MNVHVATLVDHEEAEHVLAQVCNSMFTRDSNETHQETIDIHYAVLASSWWPVAICALGLFLMLCLHLLQSSGRCKPFGQTGTKWFTYACWSFLNGWADAVTYRRYAGFATMMVGNMLLLGQATVQWYLCGDDPRFLLPAPLFFIAVICLFIIGAALYRCAANCGYTGKWLAPVCLVSLGLYDLIAFRIVFEGKVYTRMSLFCLAPIFGAVNAVAVSRGLGTLPWGTTGHVVSTAFMLADSCSSNLEGVDFAAGGKAILMIISMVIGAISGTWFAIREAGTVALEYSIVGCGLALLVYINDDVFGQLEISSTNADTAPIEEDEEASKLMTAQSSDRPAISNGKS